MRRGLYHFAEHAKEGSHGNDHHSTGGHKITRYWVAKTIRDQRAHHHCGPRACLGILSFSPQNDQNDMPDLPLNHDEVGS
jgi:hypothetical protein